jgi:hypothetical protein
MDLSGQERTFFVELSLDGFWGNLEPRIPKRIRNPGSTEVKEGNGKWKI